MKGLGYCRFLFQGLSDTCSNFVGPAAQKALLQHEQLAADEFSAAK